MALENETIETVLTPGGDTYIPVKQGSGVYNLTFSQPLGALSSGSGSMMAPFALGHRFKILAFGYRTSVVGLGTGASQPFRLAVNETNVTGGVLTLTLANQINVGNIAQSTPLTAGTEGSATDTITMSKDAGTVFTAGDGAFYLRIQNLEG